MDLGPLIYIDNSLCLFFLNVGLNTNVHSQQISRSRVGLFDIDLLGTEKTIQLHCPTKEEKTYP